MNELEIKPGHAYAIRVTECKDEDGTVRMPTEFIGEITLCKDCKFCEEHIIDGWMREFACGLGFLTGQEKDAVKITVDPYFYCKYGEPKEVEE